MSEKKNIDDILANLDRLLDEGIENEPEEESKRESVTTLRPEIAEQSPEISTIDADLSHGQLLAGKPEVEAMPVNEADPGSRRRRVLLTADMLVKVPADCPDDKSS